MSGKLMGQVFGLVLKRGKRDVLLALADHASDDGSGCYPSVGLLAWKTDYSKRQVRRILRALEQEGLIIPISYHKGGCGHAREYLINLSKGTPKTPYRTYIKNSVNLSKGDMHSSSFDKEDECMSPFSSGSEIERLTPSLSKEDSITPKGDIHMSAQPPIKSSRKPSAPLHSLLIKNCPDCKGTGFIYKYPDNMGLGVIRCKHSSLKASKIASRNRK